MTGRCRISLRGCWTFMLSSQISTRGEVNSNEGLLNTALSIRFVVVWRRRGSDEDDRLKGEWGGEDRWSWKDASNNSARFGTAYWRMPFPFSIPRAKNRCECITKDQASNSNFSFQLQVDYLQK